MSSRTGAIECRSLKKVFGDRVAVDDVSFQVPPGTITGFVGANGAGKTTTMRMLLGLVAPSSGTAWVNGRPYRDLEQPRREVGAVVDGPGAHPGHSARTHLSIMALAGGLPRRRVDEVLDLVELTEHAHRRVDGFSMGMLQRLALAGALLGDPGILILDEPVNGLDPPGILWVRDLLRRLAEEGRALLVSSHLLSELAEVAHRVVIIDRGRLIADTTLDDLLAEQSHVVELRCADPAPLVQELRARQVKVVADGDGLLIEGLSARETGEAVAAVGAGPVYWLTERTGSFEDVYFRLAGSMPHPLSDVAVSS
ncbi:ATP-binding cassette domain-containing protein [Micromonospora sp. NPDC047548]|uniref:ABC transporter ATP-binding protein n=1 Tax=Micromonospora sp. NPDC047548 TaxID=3155624 RepID=UPI0034029FA0